MKPAPIAYQLNGFDNHAYFYHHTPPQIFCPQCGCCTQPDYYPTDFHTPNRADFSCTYDGGAPIASARFKDFVTTLGLPVHFQSLNAEHSLFAFVPMLTLPYRAAQQSPACPICQQHEDQVLPIPDFRHVAPDGIFRSSLNFGSGREHRPVIIFGTNTAARIKQAAKAQRWRGLSFAPIGWLGA